MVPGLAEGEEGLEVGEAAPEEEVLPQKPQTTPEQPTASRVADHNLTHLHYRAWCPDRVEAFGPERAHHLHDPAGRVIPLVAIDYCFVSEEGIHLKDEVD